MDTLVSEVVVGVVVLLVLGTFADEELLVLLLPSFWSRLLVPSVPLLLFDTAGTVDDCPAEVALVLEDEEDILDFADVGLGKSDERVYNPFKFRGSSCTQLFCKRKSMEESDAY